MKVSVIFLNDSVKTMLQRYENYVDVPNLKTKSRCYETSRKNEMKKGTDKT